MKPRGMAALTLLALLGCSDIQDARWAQDPASARPGERTPRAKDVGLPGDVPLSLDRGLGIALEHNPNIAIFRARVEEAKGILEQVNAGFLPQVLAQADYHVQRQGGAGNAPVGQSQIANSGFYQSHGGSVTLSQLLYDFGKTDALSRQNFELWSAAEADLQSTRNDTTFNFESGFFNVLKQEELVAVGIETVRQFEKRLEQTTVLVQVGSRQKYDLTKSQVDLGNAQLSLVKARTALAAARTTLNNVMGLAEDPPYKLERPRAPSQWTMSLEEAFGLALRNHPHLLSLILHEESARAGIDAAVAAFYPALTLQGSFSWAGSLTPVTWFSFLGPMVNYVVFSGWQQTGVLHQAVGNLREAYATRAQEEQQVYLDLRNAYTVLEDSQESLKILTLTVKQAEEQLELTQALYKNGKASAVDLTDSQVALATARGNEIEARWDYEVAIASLKRSIGGIQKPSN